MIDLNVDGGGGTTTSGTVTLVAPRQDLSLIHI